MGGGLMQLVAYGAQDIYLTGNPQITFFKVVYRRHTNFSMESIEQTWNGTSDSLTAGRCTATISRNGDLVHRMYLELEFNGMNSTPQNPMAAGITDIELEIGGQKIDKQSGEWMNTWVHLSEPNDSAHVGATTGDGAALGCTPFQHMSGMGGIIATDVKQLFFTPLQFWFCRNPGLALPLIALQYHEVKVILNYQWDRVDNGVPIYNKLWADYIYLDTDERRRFAQVSHEYLIEQVQVQDFGAGAGAKDLNFNHPVKELIWVVGSDVGVNVSIGDSTQAAAADRGTYQLKLNGHDRFAARDFRYFSKTQVHSYHTGPGGMTALAGTANKGASGQANDGIGVYSFALKPEEHQPSGTCNFSRIDNAQLVCTTGCTATRVYAVNYNVLRIMSGMGGLAYSN